MNQEAIDRLRRIENVLRSHEDSTLVYLADDIEELLGRGEEGLSLAEINYIKAGQPIFAIKDYRHRKRVPLKEAKDAVEEGAKKLGLLVFNESRDAWQWSHTK